MPLLEELSTERPRLPYHDARLMVKGALDALDRSEYFYERLPEVEDLKRTDDALEELSDAVDSVLSFARRTMDGIWAGRDLGGVTRLVAALEEWWR